MYRPAAGALSPILWGNKRKYPPRLRQDGYFLLGSQPPGVSGRNGPGPLYPSFCPATSRGDMRQMVPIRGGR